MTDDDIRERARELARAVRDETEGCACNSCIEAGAEVIDAALRAERERCARIVHEVAGRPMMDGCSLSYAADDIAAAIRSSE